MANGTIKKGSLVKNTGGSGGGGSASFPTIVTDSGSSLPVDLSGYSVGDTFLNTSDKKIYKAEETIAGYSISADVSNGVDVDLTTGIATGFETTGSGPYVYKAISKDSGGVGWVGDNKEYKIHFKLTSSPTANTNYLIYGEHTLLSSSDAYFSIRIANKKLNLRLNVRQYGNNTLLDEKDLCSTELTSGIEYYLKVVKNGNSASVTLATDGYDENIIDENTIETQDLASSLSTVQYGYPAKNGGTNSWSLGTSFTIGQIYLGDSTGNLVTPTTALSWDSGTDLTDKTEYADKTNGALYLYENSELVKIPQNKIFTNVYANNWVADSTYADYGYKCELSCSGVTANMFAQVIFAPALADSGNYATVCLTGNGTVTIYSKVNDTISIPSIVVMGV